MATSVPRRTPAQIELEALQLARQQELQRERHTDAYRIIQTRRRLMLGDLGMGQFLNPNLPVAQRQGQRMQSSLMEPANTAAEEEERRRALVGTFATNFNAGLNEILPQRGGNLT